MDIAKCAYNEYYDAPDSTHRIKASPSSKVDAHLFPFKIAQYPELLIHHPSIWSAIYRREFLEENQLRAVYKRCLNYIQLVTEHQAYQPSKDDILIRQVVSRIPFSKLCNDYFTVQERAMHRIFSAPTSEK